MGLDDIFKNKVASGLAIGIGASILAPVVVSVLSEVGKPILKATMKSGILLFEKTKELAAEVTETTEDLWAEAKAELEEELVPEPEPEPEPAQANKAATATRKKKA